MTYASVAQAAHRSNPRPGAFKRAARRMFGADTPTVERYAQTVEIESEPDPFPHPDLPTEVLPPVETAKPHPKPTPPSPHRTTATDPDEVAIRIGALCFRVLSERRMSSTDLRAQLAPHLDELDKRAGRELAAGRKMQERQQAAHRQAARLAAAIEAAVLVEDVTGVKADLDPAAMGAGLAAMTANAQRPEDPTTTFPRITDDMPDPRETPAVEITTVTALTNGTAVDVSPLHRADGVAPAIPAEEPEDADPGDRSLTGCAPLPHRPHRTDSFPARLDEHGEPVDGGQVDAMDVKAGTWLLHWGRWCLIAAAEVRGDQMHIRLASGVMDDPHISASVRVLGAEAASTLLAETEAQYTEVTR